MKTYRDCWVSSATALFSQALAGEPRLVEVDQPEIELSAGIGFVASLSGDLTGQFTVVLDPLVMETPLLGDGVDQKEGWAEILREVAEAAAGELLADAGVTCRVDSIRRTELQAVGAGTFRLVAGEKSWAILVRDELRPAQAADSSERRSDVSISKTADSGVAAGVELLLDVEIEAALRFGCCEMSLGEILELGPGAIVELDRHVSDPVDLIVGDKIVAKGDVVLVNGNFGLRVTEIATPQKRLESIRCLF